MDLREYLISRWKRGRQVMDEWTVSTSFHTSPQLKVMEHAIALSSQYAMKGDNE